MRITPFYRRLDFKIIVGLMLALLAVGLPFLIAFYSFHKHQLIDTLKESTTNLSRLVVGSLETAMLQKQPHLLNDEVKRLSEQSHVDRIMILNKKGEVRVSSDSSMIGRVYENKSDPTCLVCHQFSPTKRKNTAIVRNGEGQESFRNMNLIYNEPRCHGCHDPAEPINGVLVMDLSMAPTRAQLASNMRTIFAMALVMVLVTIGALVVLLHRLILRRIKRFTDTTERIRAGQLDEVIEFKEADEIGELARSFNRMTANLKETLTEVQRHKEYLEHVINGITDEIVVVDRDHNIVTANDAFLGRTGTSRAGVVGRKCFLVGPDSGNSCSPYMANGCPARETFRNGTLQRMLHTYLDSGGRQRYVEIYCSPLRDEAGEIFQVIEVRRDITERKQLEAQLIHSEKLTSVGRLAASVAHEINNPLDGIQDCIAIIQKHPEDKSKVREMMELISEGLSRIAFIVRRLLIYTRHHALSKEEVDLNEVVEKSIVLVRHKLEDQGVELRTRFEPSLPRVYADPYNLSQVVVNVLLNASDAVEERADGCITIETAACEHKGKAVEVRIQDNGCGIPPENLDRIFSPFFTTKDAEKGTGLGLSISKKIIEEHNGDIFVESVVGQGTTVRVVLPA
jgi:PAS domain S-box-containing protein